MAINVDCYEHFVREMLMHCYCYYELDQPLIEDHVYDQMYKALVTFERILKKPLPYSPTQLVGFNKHEIKQILEKFD